MSAHTCVHTHTHTHKNNTGSIEWRRPACGDEACTYTHIFTHTYLHIHVCTHTHTRALPDQENGGDHYFCGDESCIYTHISTHPYLHLQTCAHTHAQVATKHHVECIHAHIICTCEPLDARLQIHIYTYTSVHTHTCTHAQVQYRIKRTEATIIFVATKHHVEYIHALITAVGCTSCMLYGAMDPSARKISIGRFRAKLCQYMV